MKALLAITKALADQTRLRIVGALLCEKELCVCQITALLNLATATISRHMSVLQHAELVTSRKDGRWVYYKIIQPNKGSNLKPVMQWLEQSLEASDQLKRDKKTLKKIMSCDAQELSQKKYKEFGDVKFKKNKGIVFMYR